MRTNETEAVPAPGLLIPVECDMMLTHTGNSEEAG